MSSTDKHQPPASSLKNPLVSEDLATADKANDVISNSRTIDFKKLNGLMKTGTADRAELARLVRELCRKNNQGQTEACSSDEKELLVAASLAVIEPRLSELLRQMRLSEAALPLVCSYNYDLNTTARGIASGSLKNKLETTVISALTTKLETRGAVAEAGAAFGSRDWLETLCKEYPTKLALQQLKWATIEDLMKKSGSEDASLVEKEAVWRVWSEDNTLRKKVKDYGLPPEAAEWIVDNGFQSMEAMKESELLEIQQYCKVEDKAKLRRMWTNESKEGHAEIEIATRERMNLIEKTKKAAELVAELKKNVKETGTTGSSDTSRALDSTLASLGLNEWSSSIKQVEDPALIMDNLVQLGNVLECTKVSIADMNGDRESDEIVISRASGSLALHGVSFGFSASNLGRKAEKPLLRAPEFCPLQCPEMIISKKSIIYNSIEAADNFRASIKSCGETITSDLKASGWGFQADASYSSEKKNHSKEKAKTTRKSTTAVSVMYCVVPVKSFRISRENMRLSSEAERAAKAVTTLKEAQVFLEDYGTHIPCGTQHLGGIFWKIVEVHSEEEMELAELELKISHDTDAFAGLGGAGWGCEGGFAGSVHLSSASRTANGLVHQKKSYKTSTRIECTGPNVGSFDLFSQALAVNNQSWFLIDRGSPMALVPVWDLLLLPGEPNCKTLDRTQKLLRDAWIEKAERFSFLQDVDRLLFRAKMQDSNPLNSLTCDISPDKEQSLLQVRKLVYTVSSIALDDANPELILKALETVFSKMYHFDYRFETFVVADFMRNGVFARFLAELASMFRAPNAQPALKYLSSVLNSDIKAKLLSVNPPVELDKTLERVLDEVRSSTGVLVEECSETTKWRVPEVSLSDLPSTVKTIVHSFLQSTPVDIELMNERVQSVIYHNLGCSTETLDLCSQLQGVANRFYGGGNPLFSIHSLMALATEMENIVQCPSPDEVLLPENVSRFEFDTGTETTDGLPYSYVRTNWQQPRRQDLQALVLFVLVHCLDINKLLYAIPCNVTDKEESGRRELEAEPRARISKRAARFRQTAPGTTNSRRTNGESVFDAVVQLLQSLDTPARSEVIRLLLERRFIVPLIVPTASAQDEKPFYFDLSALSLFTTIVGNDEQDIIRASISSDTSHIRVAVLSDRAKNESTSPNWIKSVFHTQSFHVLDSENKAELTKLETAAEIGWGFLKNVDGDHIPVMLLHVVGDYRPLSHFIAQFADAVVLDSGSNNSTCDISLKHGTLVKWSFADPDQGQIIESDESDPVFEVSLRCRYTQSISEITELLMEEYEVSRDQKRDRVSLMLMHLSDIYLPQMTLYNFDGAVTYTSFESLRSELRLQIEFTKEAHEVIALQRESNQNKVRNVQANIPTYRRNRDRFAPQIENCDIMCLFKGILNINNAYASQRVFNILSLENWLAKQSEKHSISARKAYRTARNVWHDDRSSTNCEALAKRLKEWDMKTLTLEHLWRELSHLYAIDPQSRNNLARLAAQHLLDGFSLELMDGDACTINPTWIRGVFTELHRELGSARLLVLSVMGVQSSGKSTLLNYMFGVRLRTSVSRCTRGVNMQLLKCEGRDEYEYILLLDTEGLRAPEYIGTDDSVWRDNRMATFAILPADATIILTKGESTTTINEVLPIVLSAYLESETAQRNGGQLPSKLFFVFNQIDVAEKSKLENVFDTLMRELNENARKVEEIHHGCHLEESGRKTLYHRTTVFQDLRVDVTNEEGSDFRVLGSIKAESYPPRDTPLAEYGTKLLKLREHIHHRICDVPNWKGRNMDEFNTYVMMVWKCIERSNFHFNFVAAYERIYYDVLVSKIDQLSQQLTSLYSAAFDVTAKNIRESADSNSNHPANIHEIAEAYDRRLNNSMEEHLKKLHEAVNIILDEDHFKKWRTYQLSRWERCVSDQVSYWKSLLHSLVDTIYRYESLVEEYKKKLRERANCLFRGGEFNNYLPQQKLEGFNQLFDQLVREAEETYPPSYKKIVLKIDNVFREYSHLLSENSDHFSFEYAIKFAKSKATSMIEYASPFHQGTQESNQSNFQLSIEQDVKKILKSVTQYSDGIVLECIQVTRSALLNAKAHIQVTDSFKELVCKRVKHIIHEELAEIQKKWDSENSVAARFESCRPNMKSYFENLGKGWLGMDLLQASVCDLLSSTIVKSFEEELTAIVGNKLKNQRWVANADVMQALVDNSLVKLLEQNKVYDVIYKIQHSKRLTEDIVSQQIALEVSKCVAEKLAAYKNALKESIKAAARRAAQAEKDCALIFLTTLKSNIRDYLHTGATNCLLTSMPDAKDANFNCDDQSAEIFNQDSNYFMCAAMLDVIDFTAIENVDITRKVWTYIKDRAHGSSGGVMPRCGEPCPLCKSPCTRELGHTKNESEKRHDSYHQPAGLVGSKDIDTHELLSGSCSSNVKNGAKFRGSTGKWHKCSDFDKVFPTWCLPVEKDPLLLREYIFFNYQVELSLFYSSKNWTSIPFSYNHSLGDIKQYISTLLS